jgi:translation initiation factor IF-2
MSTKAGQNLVPRPPVVVIMGHIDHGKSTLLDYIRKTNIVASEAGGITQHVGAYQVDHTTAEGKTSTITFIDTPGHEAFCNIRERGARAADIAVLAVSAEDGVKPQTLEALGNIKDEKIPFIVAITKIDKPNADIDKTKQSLGENEIYVEGWGGDTPVVPISATKGTGISELLDMIMLVAELASLKTDPSVPATGIIVESTLDQRKGVSATLLIQNGALKTGTYIVSGSSSVPVRFIENFKGEKIESATASMPVRIIGWNKIPVCGCEFITIESKKEAERLASQAAEEERRQALKKVEQTSPAPKKNMTVEDEKREKEALEAKSKIVTIPLILKADVIGSLEGIKFELKKIVHDKVKLKIISEGIGAINENDVKVAMSDPNTLLIGFNADPDKKAASIIERSPVNVKLFRVIYELTEFVRNTLLAKVPKEYVEEVTGRAKILALFSHEKDRQVIGGKVETGTIGSGNEVRIIRRDAEIGRGKIRELQTKKVRTQEVAEGHEFGMMLEAKVEIAPGDRIESVRTIEKK